MPLRDHIPALLDDVHVETEPLAPFTPKSVIVDVVLPENSQPNTTVVLEFRARSLGDPRAAFEDRLEYAVVILPAPTPTPDSTPVIPEPTAPDAPAETPGSGGTLVAAEATVASEATAPPCPSSDPSAADPESEAAVPIASPQVAQPTEPCALSDESTRTITVVVEGGERLVVEPGSEVDLVYTVTLAGEFESDHSVPGVVAVATTSQWPVALLAAPAAGDGTEERAGIVPLEPAPAGGALLLVPPTGSATLLVRVSVPADAPDGTSAEVTLSAWLDSAASSHAQATDAGQPQDDPDTGLADGFQPATAASILTVDHPATLNVLSNGIDFGNLTAIGTGANPGIAVAVDDHGATYTASDMIIVEVVADDDEQWQISCQAVGAGLIHPDGSTRLEWRVGGSDAWHPFPTVTGICLAGTGSKTIALDVRYRVDWSDPLGPLDVDLRFDLESA